MPYQISILPKHGIIEISHSEAVTAGELHEAAEAAIAGADREAQTYLKFLSDVSAAELNVPVFEVFNLPKRFKRIRLGGHCKNAVLVGSDSKDKNMAAFYETVTFNQGLRVKLFTSRKKALAWLG